MTTSPPTPKDLERVAQRLLTEARWRDGTKDTPSGTNEAQVRRDLYYYILGREGRLPAEWTTVKARADLQSSAEYALYAQLREKFRLLDAGLPIYDAPSAPVPGKEHAALAKLGIGAYDWLRMPVLVDDSGMAKRIRSVNARKKRAGKRARESSEEDNDDDDDNNNNNNGGDDSSPYPTRLRSDLRQSSRLIQTLNALPRHKKRRIGTMNDLRRTLAAPSSSTTPNTQPRTGAQTMMRLSPSPTTPAGPLADSTPPVMRE